MIEVKVPKDLSEYKEKAALGMTLRQLICFGAACCVSAAAYWLLGRAGLGRSLKGYLSMAASAPWLAIGFIEVNSMPFERFAALVLRRLASSGARPYIAKLESSGEEGNERIQKINGIQKRRNRAEPERLREEAGKARPARAQRESEASRNGR